MLKRKSFDIIGKMMFAFLLFEEYKRVFKKMMERLIHFIVS